MSITTCPLCPMGKVEVLENICLCNVMPDICDGCIEKVLNNYTCPVCSALLPRRVSVEMGLNYLSVVSKITQA